MKLFGLFVAFVAAEDQWDISFDNEVGFNTTDEGYKAFQNMNDQITAEDAGMEFGIHERGKVGTSNASIEKMQMRKYETIKKMTLYLHDEDEREWGRYCPYGCHCAVNGPTDLMAGAGQPVDEIDSACKRHKECIQCALADFDQAVCPWWKPFKMTAMVDDITGEKHLVCSKYLKTHLSICRYSHIIQMTNQATASDHCASVMHNSREICTRNARTTTVTIITVMEQSIRIKR